MSMSLTKLHVGFSFPTVTPRYEDYAAVGKNKQKMFKYGTLLYLLFADGDAKAMTLIEDPHRVSGVVDELDSRVRGRLKYEESYRFSNTPEGQQTHRVARKINRLFGDNFRREIEEAIWVGLSRKEASIRRCMIHLDADSVNDIIDSATLDKTICRVSIGMECAFSNGIPGELKIEYKIGFRGGDNVITRTETYKNVDQFTREVRRAGLTSQFLKLVDDMKTNRRIEDESSDC